eukprot:TRINITY_DN1280_c0_g2_i1.p1 TRINITY_DN1280_c0_g2~~TRINITY_DN1280_c0_g2_i1.p1  ORF type:complete len:325 (-),score=59.27 TRINITY_DN1280_c0_g2_i1:100-1074(-)
MQLMTGENLIASPNQIRFCSTMKIALLTLLSLILVASCTTRISIDSFDESSQPMPCPFSRELYVQHPPMQGKDVFILQNLLVRSRFVKSIVITGLFDNDTSEAVAAFQKGNNISPLMAYGAFDVPTASAIIEKHLQDGYKDDGTIPAGAMYKVHIPVHLNRSIETMATLYDANMTVMHTFKVRTHGQNDMNGNQLNQYCSNGATPTGLSAFDLNSPENDPKDYGPYPVNRFTYGLKGNAAIILQNDRAKTIRDGILMHTGEWPNWTPNDPMPNSHGCVHGHPMDIKAVFNILTERLGVKVNQNTDGALPYPYKPQGVVSVELVQ